MTSPLVPLSLFVSLALLVFGAVSLAQAQGVLTTWVLYDDPMQALVSGVLSVLAGAHNLHNATLPAWRAERGARRRG